MSRELLLYIAKRFGQLLLIVFIAVSVNFVIPRLLPGDPVETAIARLQASGAQNAVDVQAIVGAYRAKYGLDEPMVIQYLNYWRDLLQLKASSRQVAGGRGRPPMRYQRIREGA